MSGFPRDLGVVSAKYESGGRGVDFVSNGSSWGDPGGDSYGIHQLSGAYSMGAFLRSKWGVPYAAKFGKLRPGTKSFNRKYIEIARADPEGFAYAQKAYYATTHYLPLRDHAAHKGFDVEDRGVQEALFSMSVQHGKAKLIVNEVVEDGVPQSAADQVKALFRERGKYVMGLRSLSRTLKNNIVNNRYKSEVKDALAYVGSREEGEREEIAPSPTLDNDVGDSVAGAALGLADAISGLAKKLVSFAKRVNNDVVESVEKLPDIEDLNIANLDTNVVQEKEAPWMATAKKLIGTREISGKRSNNVIMSWARALGRSVRNTYTNDDIPWCGLFVAHIFNENGINQGPPNPLGARQWLKFGESCDPQYGAVMVFWRGKKSGWAGPVGVYVSEDENYYHILGGNQSNSVNVTKVAKSRFLGARWPKGYGDLKKRLAGRIVKRFDGKVSTNEQ